MQKDSTYAKALQWSFRFRDFWLLTAFMILSPGISNLSLLLCYAFLLAPPFQENDQFQYGVNIMPKKSMHCEPMRSYVLLSILRLQTALHKAAWYGYRGICKILVDRGASLLRKDYQVGKHQQFVAMHDWKPEQAPPWSQWLDMLCECWQLAWAYSICITGTFKCTCSY